MRKEINAVDLACVVDTTGSMGSLIAATQNQMVAMTLRQTNSLSRCSARALPSPHRWYACSRVS